MGSARHVWGLVTGRDWAVGRSAGVAGDAHGRRPIERRAVGVCRRPVHRLIARPARPCGVPAAVPETSLVTDENLSGAGLVTVRATRRQVHDPLPGRGLYKLAQHDYEANRADSHRA
jgi:hypothetical protein